jgi:O-antigen/teichoic acid export membrane protein
MGKLKRLASETVLYGLGSIVPRMLNFLLVPLYTINMFSKAEYGAITKLYALVAVVNIVYMFGMETAFFRFATKSGAVVKNIFRLAQTSVLLVSIISSILLIVFAPSIASSVGAKGHPEFIYWVTATMFIDAVVAIPFAKLRLEKKALQFVSIKIVNVLLLIALNFCFLKFNYNPDVGIGYVFLANLLANSLFILVFIKTLLSWRPLWDAQLSPQMLRYAYPVMLTGMAGMFNEMFSRYMLDWWLPEDFYPGTSRAEAGGIFGACYKFAVFMNLGIQAFRYAAEPFFFSNATDKNSPALFAKVNHYFIIVCCIVLLSISINLDVLKYFIGNDFWPGLSIVPVLLMAYLFLGIYYNMGAWFKLTDKTQAGTYITLLGVVVTVAGNYFLIPLAGYMGSSLAAFLCYFTMALVCYWAGQKYYPIPYRIKEGLTYITATFMLIYLVNAVVLPSQWLSTTFHVLVIVIYIFALYLLERHGLKEVRSHT